MMKILGPFIFLLSFNALAETREAILQLKAVVPVRYQVEIKMTETGPKANIRSNVPGNQVLPHYVITQTSSLHKVAIIHP